MLSKWKISLCHIIQIIAYDDVQIILIEDYPCDRKDQLLQRESYWIQLLDCVIK